MVNLLLFFFFFFNEMSVTVSLQTVHSEFRADLILIHEDLWMASTIIRLLSLPTIIEQQATWLIRLLPIYSNKLTLVPYLGLHQEEDNLFSCRGLLDYYGRFIHISYTESCESTDRAGPAPHNAIFNMKEETEAASRTNDQTFWLNMSIVGKICISEIKSWALEE